MDPFDSHLDKAYEQLNEAIMKAIVSSKDVKTVLNGFKDKDMINNLAVLNLILSLEELSDLVFSKDGSCKFEKTDTAPATESQETPAEQPSQSPYLIDGKSLTPNEVLFERFFQGKFDEADWLRKFKIRL